MFYNIYFNICFITYITNSASILGLQLILLQYSTELDEFVYPVDEHGR